MAEHFVGQSYAAQRRAEVSRGRQCYDGNHLTEHRAMLLRLYNDDSPLIGLVKDNMEQAVKGPAPEVKDGSSDRANEDQTLNDNRIDRDGMDDNASPEQANN